MSILSKNSLAITDFHAKKTQHVQLFENPLPGTPPFAIPKFGKRFSSFFCWGKIIRSIFPSKTPPQISPSNFTTRFWVVAGPKIYAVQNWILEMPYKEPFSRPQPQYRIKFLDPWLHDFYPALGWGLATSGASTIPPSTRTGIKIWSPRIEVRKRTAEQGHSNYAQPKKCLCALLLALELFINSCDFLGKVGQSQVFWLKKPLMFAEIRRIFA